MKSGKEKPRSTGPRRDYSACGAQVSSLLRTNPSFSIGGVATRWRPASKGKQQPDLGPGSAGIFARECRVPFEMPLVPSPGPIYDVPHAFPSGPSPLRGFGTSSRFLGEVRLSRPLPSRGIVHSTHASPFSPAYPYEPDGHASTMSSKGGSMMSAGSLASPRSAGKEAFGSGPIAQIKQMDQGAGGYKFGTSLL